MDAIADRKFPTPESSPFQTLYTVGVPAVAAVAQDEASARTAAKNKRSKGIENPS
jgi:hypothetical protein